MLIIIRIHVYTYVSPPSPPEDLTSCSTVAQQSLVLHLSAISLSPLPIAPHSSGRKGCVCGRGGGGDSLVVRYMVCVGRREGGREGGTLKSMPKMSDL